MTATDRLAETVDSCVRAFEAAGERGPAAVAAHLPPVGHPARAAAAAELVRVDLELGWTTGRPHPLADYLRQFPELRTHPDRLAEVCFEEFRQRAERGEPADPSEYESRYGADTAGWESAVRPGTAVVSTPAPVSVADADWSGSGGLPGFRLSDAEPGSASVALPATDANDRPRLLRELQVSAPAVAHRLKAASFPEVGGEFGGFTLASELGRGAFARVFLAHQHELAGRPVALKVSAAKSDESATLAQLQHTNIVPVYSVHRHGPMVAVCMPFFGATTLADVVGGLRDGLPQSGRHIVSTLANRRSVTRVDSQPSAGTDTSPAVVVPAAPAAARPVANTEVLTRLSAYSYVEAVLWLVARLADGLHHAHSRGVIHRDLKPANVLLTDDGQPMLLDFNLADDANAEGAAVARVGGTLPYMAPEHLRAFAGKGDVVDARSDLYSLGLIAFELLAGRGPFPTPTGAIAQVLPAMIEQRSAVPPALRPLNPNVGPAVEAVVHKLLAADPAARYQSARELKEDVERHLADRPLRYAPNPSRRERLSKWCRRHPRLSSSASIGAVAAGLLLAAAGGAFLLYERNRGYAAEKQLDEFLHDGGRQAVALAAGIATPDRLPADLGAARQNLDRFGLLSDPDWENRPEVRRLFPDRRDVLRHEAGVLLGLMARAGRMPEAGATDAERQAARAEADRFDRQADALLPADPRSAPRLTLAARDLLARKKYAEAAKVARHAVDADARRPDGWFTLGLAAHQQGDNLRAETAYDVALALGADAYHVRVSRGLSRYAQKKFRDAEADFAAAMARPEDDGRAAFNRAVARQSAGNYPGALADLETARQKGFDEVRVLFARSRVHRLLKDPQAAAADLQAGLKLVPTDRVGWVSRALARRATDPAAAVADLDQSLALSPGFRAALQTKADILAEDLKRPADGAAALTQILASEPANVIALASRAVLYARMGDRAKAVADAEATLGLSRDAEPVYRVAGAYALLSAEHPDDRLTALRLLTEALRGGFGFEHLATDPELKPLRGDPEFEKVVTAARRLQQSAK